MLEVTEEKKEQPQPVIVKKGKGGHGGHHGGAWKVAYADFVTAMMAFFLVMWLVGQSNAVKESVGGYFRDPVKSGKGQAGAMKSEGGTKPKIGTDAALRRRMEEEVRKNLNEVGESIKKEMNSDQSFAAFKNQVEIEMTDEGLRIQLIESGATPFFQKGSDRLEPFAAQLVEMIGRQLGGVPNHIVIEGHTDALQYPDSAQYTNWELSADRANAARRLMLAGGLNQRQIAEIRGFAERQPRIKLNPADPRNRRITITVLNDFEIYRYSDTLYVEMNNAR